MPFLGIIWILPKSKLVLNFGAISTACGGPAKMAQKFEISLDFGRIQIVPKNGIFRIGKLIYLVQMIVLFNIGI